MASATATTTGTPPTGPSHHSKRTLWIFIAIFAVLNVIALGVILYGNSYGYNWNVPRLLLLLAVVDLIAIPAFLSSMRAVTHEHEFGNIWQVWTVCLFGLIFLLVGMNLLPPEPRRWILSQFSPYAEDQLVPKPAIGVLPAPGAPVAPAPPEGTERIYVTEIPKNTEDGKPLGAADTVIVQLRVDPAQAKEKGVLVDKNRKEIHVFYKIGSQKSFASTR